MCGFAVRDTRAGKQMCCAECFEPQPSRPRGRRVCFFKKLAQMGCACGLLALAPLPGSVNTAWPLPQDTCGLSCLTA